MALPCEYTASSPNGHRPWRVNHSGERRECRRRHQPSSIAATCVYSLGFYQAWLQTYLVRGHDYSEAALALSSLTCLRGSDVTTLGGSSSGRQDVRRFATD